MSLLGVLFAGGESRRFGGAKALARLHGRPLWAFGVDALRPCGRVVALANDPAVARALAVETRPDVRQGRGPLGGLETALLWARETGSAGALILGCDMPWVGQGPVSAILAAWDGKGVVSIEADGRWGLEPMCSAVPVSALRD
ncbi:MAG: NTP transferase domain-containing protein, partial [Gemmatimonadota bacterium]|nr:NTP transferase domain-containing protein [Gemmatimonadota bacterium]